MESKILREAISGDSEALSILIDKYKDIAFNLALGIVRNKEDAKDITQDSFLKVLENIHKFRNESKFTTWLYRIVYNQSIGFKKRSLKIEFHDINTIDVHQQPMQIECEIEEYAELYQIIDQLEDSERNIIQLFYLGEKSLKEIHQITELSIPNIKVILHRSRRKMFDKISYEARRQNNKRGSAIKITKNR
jgi:RNA polymerase sigma factor (sigma-70 family)